MTLVSDIDVFHQEYDLLKPYEHVPKLPFDINDYLNFELNEDFISSNGEFINDYSTCSDSSNHSDSQQLSSSSFQLSLGAPLKPLEDHEVQQLPGFNNDKLDQVLGQHPRYMDDNERISRYRQFKLDEVDEDEEDDEDYYQCFTRGYKQSPKVQTSNVIPSNDFKLSDYDHPDFGCLVITKQTNAPCKNKITCSFHSNYEKSRVKRCDTIKNLIKNFKHLQKLNEEMAISSSLKKRKSKLLTHLKRHNSFDNHYHIRKKAQLLNPSDILNAFDNDDYEYDDEDGFINTLMLKIGLLRKDPIERLMEFEYKTELKNLATIEYYKNNKFSL